MLKTRVITAVIGFIIALGAITLGGFVYDVLITLLALLGWREFVLLGKAKHVRMSILWGYFIIDDCLCMSSVYFSNCYISIEFISQLYVMYIW